MKRINFLLTSATLCFLVACNNAPKTTTPETTMPAGSPGINPAITEAPFGTIAATPITKYTLKNGKGMEVSILNYGGTIAGIIVPDKNGVMGNVVLSYDSLNGYLQKTNPYFGGLIGRYGNRIAKGRFTLDNKTYKLAQNDHGNSLHGGLKGFDKVIWTVEKPAGDSSLRLSYLSKDGEEGYPGNLHVEVIYTLGADNELRIAYTATTDKATPINLTNHAYFNLSAGRDSTILEHELYIKANSVTAVDDKLIPTGQLAVVDDGPMDFNKPKLIGQDIAMVKGGYDHNWVLKRSGVQLEAVATLYHPGTGREMQVLTTEPGLQFYSGNFLDGTLSFTHAGAKYVQHAGLCLEAQHFPDSPNQSSFPGTILQPGETYQQLTVYKFGTR